MRLLILAAAVLQFFVSCKNEEGKFFTVTGTVKNRPARMVYLEETPAGALQSIVWDSAAVSTDGKFSLRTKAKDESIYNLRVDQDMYPYVSLINDAEKINVDADFKNEKEFYTVQGSVSSQSVKEFLKTTSEKMQSIFSNSREIENLKKAGESEGKLVALKVQQQQTVLELKNYAEQTISNAKNPTLALFLLTTYQGAANNQGYGLEPFSNEGLSAIINQLSGKFPAHAAINSIKASLQVQTVNNTGSGWVGKPAPEIKLPDTEGKEVSLSSLRGKYVLVDFWASWCRPCRDENPNVVEAYNKFRNKNFTILGVSLDLNKQSWMRAIVNDGLNWTHISDLKQWGSEVVPLYGIQGIPFNVLVSPDGKVIAENLRGGQLHQQLEKALK
jgi:peroxiredoxin